jgi:hypothetical protein
MKKRNGFSPDVIDALMLTFLESDDINEWHDDIFEVDWSNMV